MPKLSKWIAGASVCAAFLAASASTAFADGRQAQAFAGQATVSQVAAQGATQEQAKTRTLHVAGGSSVALSQSALATSSQPDPRALGCLSEALYFEARGEGIKGQAAVAEVILNRVDHPAFPQNVCAVVNQPAQFSYKGRVSPRIRDTNAYRRAQRVAQAALTGAPRELTKGATYFHTTAVKPRWSNRFERTTRIGAHIFYRRDSRLAMN